MKASEKIMYWSPEQGALGYQDVLLRPAYSRVGSRYSGEIDMSASVANGVPCLNIPLISAGMDTVTETQMAIQMALLGGLGEIHRNLSIQKQVDMVTAVKGYTRVMEERPPLVTETTTIGEVKDFLQRQKRGYVVVYQGGEFAGKISGMATEKDFKAGTKDAPISTVMSYLSPSLPDQRQLISVKEGTTLEEAVDLMRELRIEKVPVLKPSGELVGVYTYKDYLRQEEYPQRAVDNKGRLLAGAAIGVKNENVKEREIDRAHMLEEAGVDVFFLDIAHAHASNAEAMIHLMHKENIKVPIVMGNFSTGEGVLFAHSLGAAGVKVGIGAGSVCWTRDVAGAGTPQITAIAEAREAMDTVSDPIPICGDGGIRQIADISKGIVAGANTIMIGGGFAGTPESPGKVVKVDGKLMKEVRGMASKKVAETMRDEATKDRYVPEGRSTFVPVKELVEEIVMQYVGGLASGLSYVASTSIEEAHAKGKLQRISPLAHNEQGRSY